MSGTEKQASAGGATAEGRGRKKKNSVQEHLQQKEAGDVQTLRTRLQARRATLNEEIQKEEKFHKGSRRLVRASSDYKTRDQAMLEASFAESKIRALQAELSKINSSLQAYQLESARETQVPIIPLALKTTTKLSVIGSFSDIISKHYHGDPAAFQESMYEFQELRYGVSNVSRDELGLDSLLEYHNHLHIVSKRFLSPRIRHGLAFVWYDAINGVPAIQTSVIFEKACVIFNIGALHTQIAAQQDRSSLEGLEIMVEELERAMGCLQYMKGKFSNSPTPDMADNTISFLSELMKAQVLEAKWEMECVRGEKDDTAAIIDYAHKTKAVAECYSWLKESTEEEHFKEYLPESWISYIKVKDAHYKALAHYYAAVAHNNLAIACSEGKVVSEELRTDLRFLYSVESEEAQEAITNNHQNYHVGLVKSHLNCALLSHEYAIKYNSFSRDLTTIKPLCQMLQAAAARTKLKKEESSSLEGVTIVAPAIIGTEMEVNPRAPEFSSIRVQDLFYALGPLPAFSAESSWSPPRTLSIRRGERGFGFSIRASKPVKISSVDEGGPAEAMGLQTGDWVLSVSGHNTRHKSHDLVVEMVKECGDEVTIEVATPT